jgi:hypothetical protein
MMAKWRYFDDQPAPVGTWTNVHNVIKYAENLAMMNKNLFNQMNQFLNGSNKQINTPKIKILL